jgi:hypothetical protein
MDLLSMRALRRLWPASTRLLSLALLLVMSLLAEESASAQGGLSEYDLKAAFVYQFLAYVTWPEAKPADGRVIIGVLGANELAGNLAALARETDGTRVIEVRTLAADADPRDLHVLFVAADVAAEAAALLQSASANGVLTVTETVPRSPHSIINFEVIGGKVRFDVALDLARQNDMDISARLLQVALRVVEQP